MEKLILGWRNWRFVLFFLIVLNTSSYAQKIDSFKYSVANADGSVVLLNHIPKEVALKLASKLSHANASQALDLRIVLPSKDQAGLDKFINELYDPKSPIYHKFLTADQFNLLYGASSTDSAMVKNYLNLKGLTVRSSSKNGFILNVAGQVSTVEPAFKVRINNYKKADGTFFFAPEVNPTIPPSLAGKINAIIGMDNITLPHPHVYLKVLPKGTTVNNSTTSVPVTSLKAVPIMVKMPTGKVVISMASPPSPAFSGPDNTIEPNDFKTAYNLNSVASTGATQTVGLYELDGFLASDITTFEGQFGLPNMTLTVVPTDGYSEAAGQNSLEDVLDIELVVATAPGLNGIRVYEAPWTFQGGVDNWTTIVDDPNRPNVISISWGQNEAGQASYYDHSIFSELAALGVTVFASAGDAGAYDNCDGFSLPSGSPPTCTIDGTAGGTPELSVDDPASDPYVTSAGISVLSVNSNETYSSEAGSLYGGGGISGWTYAGMNEYVPIPSYQTTVALQAAHSAMVSTTKRNVPDVVLTADPATAYLIYFTDPTDGAGWYAAYGSSAASPLWGAFASRVNQGRVAAGQTVLGALNPLIYQIAQSSRYTSDFHDITTGTNDYYPAAAGYDDATGLGSFNGANLYIDLVGLAAPTNLQATPGSSQVALTWTGVAGVSSYNVKRSTVSGSSYAIVSTSGAVTTTNYTDSPLSPGTYYYVVSAVNTAGIDGANSSQATAVIANVLPSITVQPANQAVTAPATATFSVTATGTPTPTYQWQQSTDSGSTWTTIGAATNSSYTTGATSSANNGTEFECVISNTAGSVTSNAATLTVNVTPNITSQPSNQTVTAPATATFSVTANGLPTPVYQWQQSADSGSTWTAISGATSSSYTTPATTVSNNGTEFECLVTNTAGTVTSNPATMTVDGTPAITVQPANQTVTAPATATFSVTAVGAPTPTYQWQQSTDSGSTWTAIGGATNSSYTTGTTSLVNNGTQFNCIITNTVGSVTSNAATLTVNVAPSISVQPVNQTVTAPASAAFSVTASGTPTPTYQWQQSADGSTWTAIGGATSSTYTIPATTVLIDGYQYECVVTNAAGSVTSSPATLTVDGTPAITVQPANQTVNAPATATFSVTAVGSPTPTYQWQQSVDNGNTWTAIGGATNSSYTTGATTLSNSGTQFDCVITNTVGGVTSNAATLTVNVAPSISVQPSNQTVVAPATATFSVTASGSPTPTYQWQQSTNGGGSWTTISGATSASYTTGATTSSNNGTQFECVITNTAGSVTSNEGTLTVEALPSISVQPANQTVNAPATATFSVTATGLPTPTYQWQQSTDNGSTWTAIGGATNSSYTTGATTLSNSGTQFDCVITNVVGSVTSNAATLTVTAIPTISVQPGNQTVTAPATATFSITATGTPTPTYQWQQSTNSGSTWTAISGATNSSYTTGATSLANSGTQFECVVTNTSGAVTSNAATLTVNTVPSISVQPSNQTVVAPAAAVFSITAAGTPAPTYQWQQSTDNGSTWSAISGATASSYTTDATSLSNNGTQFECVVTNGVGTVTSSPAILTVTLINPPTSLSDRLLGARIGGRIIFGGVVLSWAQSTSPGILQNKIYRSVGGGAFYLLTTISATTSFTDTNLTKGVTYNYEVSAFDSQGRESPTSTALTVDY